VGNSLLVGKMQNDVDLAERYPKEADKFGGLARSALPGVFRDVFLVPAYWQLIGSLTRVVALVAVFVAGTIPVEVLVGVQAAASLSQTELRGLRGAV
jgi:hypothetical protein